MGLTNRSNMYLFFDTEITGLPKNGKALLGVKRKLTLHPEVSCTIKPHSFRELVML